MNKSCKICKYWSPTGSDPIVNNQQSGRCNVILVYPFWISAYSSNINVTLETEGTYCDAYKLKK